MRFWGGSSRRWLAGGVMGYDHDFYFSMTLLSGLGWLGLGPELAVPIGQIVVGFVRHSVGTVGLYTVRSEGLVGFLTGLPAMSCFSSCLVPAVPV